MYSFGTVLVETTICHKRRHKIALKYRISTIYAKHESKLVQNHKLIDTIGTSKKKPMKTI